MVGDAAEALGLRVADTSTAANRQVDLIGRYVAGQPAVRSPG